MQHRNNPIPGTLEEVPGLPSKVKIGFIPASPYYYVRTWFDGKPVLRSLKTEKQSEARKAACEFYGELLLKKAQGLPITEGSTFKKAVEGLLEDDRRQVKLGKRKNSLLRDGRLIGAKLLEFFGKDNVRNINYKRIDEYVKHMQSQDTKPGAATIKNHVIWINKVLKHAIKMELMDKMPLMPSISRQDNPQPWIDDEEYRKLLVTCDKAKGTVVVKTYRRITNELRLLCAFLVNTYLRPPDLMHMKHSDVRVVQMEDGTKVRIPRMPAGDSS
jgi:hypothetical protein